MMMMMMTIRENKIELFEKLQIIHQIQRPQIWKIKFKKSKSVYVDFTNKRIERIQININDQRIFQGNQAKYLSIILD